MDILLGQIQLLPYEFTPNGWFPCEGQELDIRVLGALFSLIGTRYGGDGQRTFCLPDLRGKEPIPGMRYFMSHNGVYPSRM